jgi:hypothetical protein
MKKYDVSGDAACLSYCDKGFELAVAESSSERSPGVESVTQNSSLVDLVSNSSEEYEEESNYELEVNCPSHQTSFFAFRVNFLLVMLVVMLADGLQGNIFINSSR